MILLSKEAKHHVHSVLSDLVRASDNDFEILVLLLSNVHNKLHYW